MFRLGCIRIHKVFSGTPCICIDRETWIAGLTWKDKEIWIEREIRIDMGPSTYTMTFLFYL